jgi:hypothetical protein
MAPGASKKQLAEQDSMTDPVPHPEKLHGGSGDVSDSAQRPGGSTDKATLIPASAADANEPTAPGASKKRPTETQCGTDHTPQSKKPRGDPGDVDDSSPPAPGRSYISPLTRLRMMREGQKGEHETISTVEELQDFIRAKTKDNKPIPRAQIQIKGKLIWASTHIVKTGELVRLHLVDLQAPESLADMHKAFRDGYDRDFLEVDQLLITATIFGSTADSAGIPPDGAIVTIRNPTRLALFMDKACQLRTKLTDLEVETAQE